MSTFSVVLMWGRVAPIGESLVTFTVMSDDGDVLASRVKSIHTAGVEDWDAIISDLGYERVGRWRPAGGLFWCETTERAGGAGQPYEKPRV